MNLQKDSSIGRPARQVGNPPRRGFISCAAGSAPRSSGMWSHRRSSGNHSADTSPGRPTRPRLARFEPRGGSHPRPGFGPSKHRPALAPQLWTAFAAARSPRGVSAGRRRNTAAGPAPGNRSRYSGFCALSSASLLSQQSATNKNNDGDCSRGTLPPKTPRKYLTVLRPIARLDLSGPRPAPSSEYRRRMDKKMFCRKAKITCIPHSGRYGQLGTIPPGEG